MGKSASGTGSGDRLAGEDMRMFSGSFPSSELALDACLSRRAHANDAWNRGLV